MSQEWPPNQWRETRPLGPPAARPPERRRSGPLVIGGVLVMVVVVAVGFGIWWSVGGDNAGAAGPAEPPASAGEKTELATLDVGDYSVEPHDFDRPPSKDEALILDAFKLAEGIVLPPEVIPTLPYLQSIPTADPATVGASLSGTGTAVVQPALERNGMISSFIVGGYPKSPQDYMRDPVPSILTLALTSFPGDQQAARAAEEMDRLDSAVNPDNVAVPIPGYPDAHSHWRPGIATIAATMARGRLVASIVLADPGGVTAELLAAQVQRILDVQVPLMDDVVPTPEGDITKLQIDPDHMLSRLFFDAGGAPRVGPTLRTYGRHASPLCAGAPAIKQNLFGTAGVDRCSQTAGSLVIRARDDAAADALASAMVKAETGVYIEREIAAPSDVPGAICFDQKQELWKDAPELRFGCYVVSGRYVAMVSGGGEVDIRQRAAAQYAVLVNND